MNVYHDAEIYFSLLLLRLPYVSTEFKAGACSFFEYITTIVCSAAVKRGLVKIH